MNLPNDWQTWQQQAQAETEQILQRLLLCESHMQPKLHQAVCYAVLGGGKRLRPLLVLAAAQLGCAEQNAVEQAMAAVEMIHAYSLVHDDMPAMDNDSIRRGKPSCHVQFGESLALLAGDALQTLAFDILSRPTALPPQRQLSMVAVLAQGSLGMVSGQTMDLQNTGQSITQSELEQMHRLKTGALIRAAVKLGALAAPDIGDTDIERLDKYAAKLGLAFQVIDDVLDCDTDSTVLGKTAGKDTDNHKATYVRLMGVSQARTYAKTLIEEALEWLQPFGGRALRLKQLAQFAVMRRH